MRLQILLALLAVMLISYGTAQGDWGVGSTARVAPATHAGSAQGAEPTWPPPSTPISDEQARAIDTENARLYGPPKEGPHSPTMIHRALPSIENLDNLPRVFVATVEGKRTGLRLRETTMRIYTPLDLRIERMIVDEIDTPAGFEYVSYGGTTAEGETEVIEGMHPPIEVGKRYLFYMVPLMTSDGRSDPKYMTVDYAMPISDAGEVEDFRPGDGRIRLSLEEAIARIQRGAGEARWIPWDR